MVSVNQHVDTHLLELNGIWHVAHQISEGSLLNQGASCLAGVGLALTCTQYHLEMERS